MLSLQTSEDKERSCLLGTWVINCCKCFHMLIPQDHIGCKEDKLHMCVSRQASTHLASQVDLPTPLLQIDEDETGRASGVSKNIQRAVRSQVNFRCDK